MERFTGEVDAWILVDKHGATRLKRNPLILDDWDISFHSRVPRTGTVRNPECEYIGQDCYCDSRRLNGFERDVANIAVRFKDRPTGTRVLYDLVNRLHKQYFGGGE